jgi:GT2 family glycosyltransferase
VIPTACTIVVATHNRRQCLAGTLARLGALPERPDIIVVDNASHDGTASYVRRSFPEVRVLELPRNIGAAARNIGVREAVTPYVAFCDDDCWWEPGALQRGIDLLDEHSGVALINARVVVDGARTDGSCSVMACSRVPKRSTCPGTAIVQFMAGATLMRRVAFLDAGGYDQRYHVGAEESLLAMDLLERGWEFVYHSDVVVNHAPHRGDRRPRARRIAVTRNRLWTAWLRRSPAGVAALTLAAARLALHDGVALQALLAALRGLPWIVRERRCVNARVERLMSFAVELPP